MTRVTISVDVNISPRTKEIEPSAWKYHTVRGQTMERYPFEITFTNLTNVPNGANVFGIARVQIPTNVDPALMCNGNSVSVKHHYRTLVFKGPVNYHLYRRDPKTGEPAHDAMTILGKTCTFVYVHFWPTQKRNHALAYASVVPMGFTSYNRIVAGSFFGKVGHWFKHAAKSVGHTTKIVGRKVIHSMAGSKKKKHTTIIAGVSSIAGAMVSLAAMKLSAKAYRTLFSLTEMSATRI